MAQQEHTEQSALIDELESSLTRLETALSEAGRAINAIRSCIPQIAALVEVVTTMESAMSFARQRLGATPAEGTPLRAVPLEPTAIRPAPAPEPAAMEPRPAEGAGIGQSCLRVRVAAKAGSLDLKAVDNAVNEQAAVSDVALIDYDGRQATLRVWITGRDPESIRVALHQSLRSRLGDEDDAEIEIEFEAQAAA